MKICKLQFIFALFGSGMIACNEAPEVELPQNVVIIFEDCPKHTSTDRFSGTMSTSVATGDEAYTPEIIVGKVDAANGYTNDMVLEDAEGNRSDYGDLLRSLRGQVVYVDLWASWCAPCRAEMPEAAKLRREYRNRGVAFVYLAVNDVRERWLEAVDTEKTCEAGGINYLVLNANDCIFLKEIGNRRIPQMLLYDREGRLVDTDAPRPSDKTLREKIDSLL